MAAQTFDAGPCGCCGFLTTCGADFVLPRVLCVTPNVPCYSATPVTFPVTYYGSCFPNFLSGGPEGTPPWAWIGDLPQSVTGRQVGGDHAPSRTYEKFVVQIGCRRREGPGAQPNEYFFWGAYAATNVHDQATFQSCPLGWAPSPFCRLNPNGYLDTYEFPGGVSGPAITGLPATCYGTSGYTGGPPPVPVSLTLSAPGAGGACAGPAPQHQTMAFAFAASPAPARGRCLHLARRTEFRAGCGGNLCRHDCGHPDPGKRAAHPDAVPGGNCQTCDEWEADS